MLKRLFYILLIAVVGCSFWGCEITRNETPANAVNSAAPVTNRTENTKDAAQKSAEGFDPGRALEQTEKADEAEKPKTASADKPASDKFELRCGWYANPTPANHWLNDADGEWIIGAQGGHQAEGEAFPEFRDDQWVKTNGNYGYGCACIRARVDHKTRRVLEIREAFAKQLSACKNDPKLREPEE